MAKKNNYMYHNANGGGVSDESGGVKNSDKECCSITCLKFSLHLFNILFFLTGCVMTTAGIRTLMDKHPALMLLSSGIYDLTAYIFIIAGIIILATAIFGCIGICRNSYTQILVYAVLLAVIFLIEACAGILCYIYKGNVGSELSESMKEKFVKEYGMINDTTSAVDQLQIGLKCCGVNSFEDWKESSWFQSEERRNNRVPDSCCISPSRFCGVRDHPSNIKYTGCSDRIASIAKDNLILIGAVAIAICLLQVIGTTISFLLHCKIRDLTHYG